MRFVTETAAEHPSPGFGEAELNARSRKASGGEAADRETSGETRTARTIPPPPIPTCSMHGNFPPPDAGLPSPAGSGRGSFVSVACGFRPDAEPNVLGREQ